MSLLNSMVCGIQNILQMALPKWCLGANRSLRFAHNDGVGGVSILSQTVMLNLIQHLSAFGTGHSV
jgi:hypothetical protein